MTIRMYIVRHAQPAEQEPNYSGEPNSPLGKLGLEQAECVGEQFAKWEKIDVIYSSSLQRAMQTAQPIYRRLGVPWHVWPLLCETDRRGWPRMRQMVQEGTHAAHVAELAAKRAGQGEYFPLLSRIGEHFPGAQLGEACNDWPDCWQPILEGETRETTYGRAKKAIAAIRKAHQGTDARIAVVCHAAYGSVLLTELLGCEPCDHNLISFSHAAIARVDLEDDGTVSLRMVNYVGHLPSDKVTEGVELYG